MSDWSPLLLKILLISLPISLAGFWGARLLKSSPLIRQRTFISLVMAALMALPFFVWLGPSLMKITLPTPDPRGDMLISFGQSLVITSQNVDPKILPSDIALYVWFVGTAIGILYLLWGVWGVHRHIRRATALTPKQMEQMQKHLPKSFGPLPLKRLRISSHIKGPGAAGFFRPWILIPRVLFERMDEQELGVVMMHEWAHIENRDGFFTLISQLVNALYWWNPLIRSFRKRREFLQEMIGDQMAAARTGALHYAKALLSLAEKSCHDRSLMGVMAFFGPITLKERIERILNKEGDMNTKKWQKGILGLGMLVMALMLVASGTEFVNSKPLAEDTYTEAATPSTQETANTQANEEKPIRVSVEKQPTLIKRVEPEYPKEALEARVTGQVILAVTTGLDGRVEGVEVVSGHPLLNEASITAVKEWQYEPYLVNGQAKRAEFTVYMTFKLGNSNKKKNPSTIKPILIKRVEPEYPKEALEQKIEGKVIVEAMIDISGQVQEATVIEGHELLVPAALAAIKQWIYEPYVIEGKPKAVYFTAVLNFKLDKDTKPGKTVQTKKN